MCNYVEVLPDEWTARMTEFLTSLGWGQIGQGLQAAEGTAQSPPLRSGHRHRRVLHGHQVPPLGPLEMEGGSLDASVQGRRRQPGRKKEPTKPNPNNLPQGPE